MTNPFVATGGDPTPRVLGDEVTAYLLTQPRLVAWVNGHTHRNEITAHTRTDGSGGFWEINTAAHIDYPQQSRLVEVSDNKDGTLSIFTTILDHAGPTTAGPATCPHPAPWPASPASCRPTTRRTGPTPAAGRSATATSSSWWRSPPRAPSGRSVPALDPKPARRRIGPEVCTRPFTKAIVM